MLDVEGSSHSPEEMHNAESMNSTHYTPLLKTKAAKLDFSKAEALKRWMIFLLTLIIPILSHFVNHYEPSVLLLISLVSAFSCLYIFKENLIDSVPKRQHEQYEHISKIFPFHNIRFYLAKCDLNTVEPSKKSIFVMHDVKKNEAVFIGGIHLQKIAMTVHPNLKNFLTGLYLKNIPVYFENKLYNELNLNCGMQNKKKSPYSQSFYVDPQDIKQNFSKIEAMKYKKEADKKLVSFAVFTEVKVSLNQPVREALDKGLDLIQRNLNTILRTASSNFPHYRFDILTDEHLINKVQSVFFDSESITLCDDIADVCSDDFEKKTHQLSMILKMIYLAIFGGFMGLLFNAFPFGLVCGALSAGYLYLKESNKQDLSEILNFERIDPFNKIEFLTHKYNPTSLFIHIPSMHMLRGIRPLSIQGIGEMFNLNMDKIFREQLFDTVSTIASVQAIPVRQDLNLFQEEFGQFLDSRNLLSPKILEVIKKKQEQSGSNALNGDITINYPNYCTASGGIWYLKYLISVVAGLDNYYDLSLGIQRISDELNDNLKKIIDIFVTKLRDIAFRDISPSDLDRSPRILLLKNCNSYLFGSLLPQFPISGARLTQLINLPAEYQKAVETIYPAEFQAPINLSAEIIYGKIINTEFNRNEALYGFNFENIYDTNLIFGGNEIARFKIGLKMMYENIIMDIPTLIVDINGHWKHLLSLFQTSQLKSKIQILTLGDNFGINPFHSEVEDDSNLDSYLSSITSIFSYLYRIQSDDEALLKECLYSCPAFDLKDLDSTKILSMMDLRLTDTKSEMRKISLIYSVIQEFSTALNLKAFRKFPNPALSWLNILKGRNCTIIDLSNLEQRKRYFGALVILKKISHLLKNYSQLEIDPRIIYLPEVDKLFHTQNASRTNTELLVPQLFSGIIEHGFGFFSECSSIADLHKEFIRIVNNITVLQMHTEEELRVATEALKLDRFFSNENNSQFRKNSYQLEFLKHLKENQALVRRNDHEFPFAVEFDLNIINSQFKVLNSVDFQEHNKKIGIASGNSNQSSSKPFEISQFERDLSEYKFLIEDLSKFLLYLQELEKTTEGLSKKAIREELDQAIGEKLYIQVKSSEIKNRKLKNIIETLIAKEYLEKNPHTLGKAQNKTILYVTNPKINDLIEQWKADKESKKIETQIDTDFNSNVNISGNFTTYTEYVGNTDYNNSNLASQQDGTNSLHDEPCKDPLIMSNIFDIDGNNQSTEDLQEDDFNDLDLKSEELEEQDLELGGTDEIINEQSNHEEEEMNMEKDAAHFEEENTNMEEEANPEKYLDDSELSEEMVRKNDASKQLISNKSKISTNGLEKRDANEKIDGFYEEFDFTQNESMKEQIPIKEVVENDGNLLISALDYHIEKNQKQEPPKQKNLVNTPEQPKSAHSIKVKSIEKSLEHSSLKKIMPNNQIKINAPIEENVDNEQPSKVMLEITEQKEYFEIDETQHYYELESKEKIKELIQTLLTPKKIEVEIKLMGKQYLEAAQLLRTCYGSFFVKYFDINSIENPTREALLLYFDRILNENKYFPFSRQELVSYLDQMDNKVKNPDEIKESKRIFDKFINKLDYYVSNK